MTAADDDHLEGTVHQQNCPLTKKREKGDLFETSDSENKRDPVIRVEHGKRTLISQGIGRRKTQLLKLVGGEKEQAEERKEGGGVLVGSGQDDPYFTSIRFFFFQ